MLEHVPAWLGGLLTGVRAGHAGLTALQPEIVADGVRLDLSSPAFASGARLPERFTADGEGVSPPLVWGAVPAETAALALVVEDPDAPAPHPLIHAIVWGLPVDAGHLEEGILSEECAPGAVGRNSYLMQGWLPPDPPTGHGTHDYVFQLFALKATVDLGDAPGRSEVQKALARNVLATGILVGTYSRGEPEIAGAPGARMAAS